MCSLGIPVCSLGKCRKICNTLFWGAEMLSKALLKRQVINVRRVLFCATWTLAFPLEHLTRALNLVVASGLSYYAYLCPLSIGLKPPIHFQETLDTDQMVILLVKIKLNLNLHLDVNYSIAHFFMTYGSPLLIFLILCLKKTYSSESSNLEIIIFLMTRYSLFFRCYFDVL